MMVSPAAVFALAAASMSNGVGQDVGFPISVARTHETTDSSALVGVQIQFDGALTGEMELAILARQGPAPPWRMSRLERASVSDGALTARATPGVETLVLLRMPGQPGYLLHGPLRWPSDTGMASVAVRWRRTIRGQLPAATGLPPTWVGPAVEEALEPWPLCTTTSDVSWECIGVPIGLPGVVLQASPRGVQFSVAPGTSMSGGIEQTIAREALWGRLLTLSVPGRTASGRPSPAVQAVPRRRRVPRARPQSLRIEEEVDDTVRIEPVGRLAFWISGAGPPGEGWIEVKGPALATARLPVQTLAAGPVELPVRLLLDPALSITGTVLTSAGAPASSTVVSLYRFDGQDDRNAVSSPRKRIHVAEAISDADGVFRFGELSDEPYEIVALHPSLGRGEKPFAPSAQPVEIRLRPFARVVGRVVRDGLGVEGLRVAWVPDLAEFQASRDPTELRGGETATDRDGRFSVALPSRGRGEIRMGDESSGVRRIPLPPAETRPPVTDLGTMTLDERPFATLVFEGSEGCDLMLIGPADRPGMTIVRPARVGPAVFQTELPEPGRWHIGATCGGRERAVRPPIVSIAGTREQTIRVTWPQ
jgi:hypothetical protein